MDTMTEGAIRAQQDPDALNLFIGSNTKFVIFAANQALGRYITESDDEYSIALIAFAEAVDGYDETKGAFSSFASLVIKRRLVDFIRKESQHGDETVVDTALLDGAMDDDDLTPAELAIRARAAELVETSSASTHPITDEIEAIGQILKLYGFDFFELERSSPVSQKTRKECARVIGYLLGDIELLDQMTRKRSLPMKDLARRCDVRIKLLERHRKYIIAATEILRGDYPLLSEYMSYIKRELRS